RPTRGRICGILARASADRVGIWKRREFVERRPDSRKIPGYSAGTRLSGVSGPHPKANSFRLARSGGQDRHQIDRILRHASRRKCERILFLASGGEVFWRGPDWTRPGSGLRAASRRIRRNSREEAGHEPWLLGESVILVTANYGA